MNKLRLTPLALLLHCFFAGNLFANSELANELANDNVEFDPAFLRGNENNEIDITRFQGKNSVAAGSYLDIDVYVNGEKKGTSDLIFKQGQDNEVHLCLTEQLMDVLDLKSSAYQFDHGKLSEVAQCIDAQQAIKDSHVRFDVAKFRLDLTLPQALTNRRPAGYTSPKLWQNGIPALFVNYNLNYYRSFLANASPISNLYLGVRGGLNYAGFSLVHTGSKTWQKTKSFTDVNKKYQSVETYLRKAIPSLQSEVLIGDIGTSGYLLDGFSLRGIRLGSDDRVLPTSQQGYAPVVQGIAKSNAVVTVKQGGYVISQVNVPAGPFLIDDLYPSASEGDLEVEITESNGEKRQFTVPFASLVQLVRPNQFKYQLAYGDFRYGSKVYHDRVFQGQLQYGLMNNLTLNSGLSLNKNYKAYLLGFGLNTKLGAFEIDGTYSDAKLNQNRFKGYSIRASYSVKIAPTDTFVTLATYRYSSRDFYTLTETVVTNNRTVNNTGSISLYNQITYRPKNQFQITLSQGLGDKLGRLYFQASTKNFWRSQNKQRQLSFSYSNNIGDLSYHLGASYSKELFGRKNTEFYLNLSLPFGTDHSISSSYYSSSNNKSLQANVSGRLGEMGSYSLGASSNQDKYRNINLNMGYSARYADINVNASADNRKNRQFSTNLSGAAVLHPYGLTLSQTLGDTFAIVRAKGATGATINGLPNQKIDVFGNGIMPYLSPYTRNYVSIDPEKLPLNVEFKSTAKEVIPKAYGVMFVKFDTQLNSLVLFDIQTNNGQIIPLGTEAFDQEGNLVGYIVQGGQLFASYLKQPAGKITLTWGEEKQSCSFDYQLDNSANLDSNQVQNKQVQCQ